MVHEFLSLVNCNIGSAFGSKIIALKDVPESRNINIFSESQGMGIVDLAFYVMYYVCAQRADHTVFTIGK